MDLTPREIDLLRESFDKLSSKASLSTTATSGDQFGRIFYEHLFALAPELRPMFRSDLEGQGMKFLSTLHVLVDAFDDEEALRPQLRQLSEGHAAYGVKPEHFAPMGEALIRTMRDALGEDMPDETEQAWRRAYDQLAEEMVALGHMR